MILQSSKKKLLPVGFRDVLTNEANLQLSYAKQLIKIFNRWGYNLIEPPLIEYEETLLDVKSDKLSNKTFTFTDPLTKETLSLRPDITVQLARIASDRLSDYPKPLRLCYYGDVFRADKPKLSNDRQFKQAGVELIGSKNCFGDIEIIILSLESLSKIGFKKISLDLNIPVIIDKILDDLNVEKNKKKELKELIAKRDIKTLKNFNVNLYEILIQLIESSGSLKKNISKIKKIKLGNEAKKEMKNFLNISNILLKQFNKYNFSIDLLEQRGFEYHSGVTFSVFCVNSKKEICRGGRYLTSKGEYAVGSTFFLNQFFKFNKQIREKNNKILIPFKNLLDKNIPKLRKKGWITIQNIDDKKDIDIAKSNNCKFIFKNGKIKKI